MIESGADLDGGIRAASPAQFTPYAYRFGEPLLKEAGKTIAFDPGYPPTTFAKPSFWARLFRWRR